jgi:hypothetical protein
MKAVWDYSKQKGAKLLLLLAIADNADDEDGMAFPGLKYLSNKVRMSQRHVKRMVQELAETDELAVVWGGGRGHSNRYYLLLNMTGEAAAEIKAEVAEENARRAIEPHTKPTKKGDKLSVKGDKMSSNNSNKKGDILSKKGDKLSVKGDILSRKGDILSVKGDIAMSPEPLEPIREPSLNHQEPVDLESSSLDWPAILGELKNAMVMGTFAHLDRTTAFVESGTLVIVTKNQFSADWINGRLKETVSRTVNVMTGQRLGIHARPKLLREANGASRNH